MKTLTESIINELRISQVSWNKGFKYHPLTKEELQKCIKKEIKIQGNNANLNCIDTSKIIDMADLFQETEFNGDVSRWDVSNVKRMEGMFYQSHFDGDLSNWDVSSVVNMNSMFDGSAFTGKNGDISCWDVRKVEDMGWMFDNTEFDGDLSKWEAKSLKWNKPYVFVGSHFENNPPKWYKELKDE